MISALKRLWSNIRYGRPSHRVSFYVTSPQWAIVSTTPHIIMEIRGYLPSELTLRGIMTQWKPEHRTGIAIQTDGKIYPHLGVSMDRSREKGDSREFWYEHMGDRFSGPRRDQMLYSWREESGEIVETRIIS